MDIEQRIREIVREEIGQLRDAMMAGMASFMNQTAPQFQQPEPAPPAQPFERVMSSAPLPDPTPHECPHCPKCFAKPRDLKRHKETHNKPPPPAEDPKPIKCPEPGCTKTFQFPSGLKRHAESHSKPAVPGAQTREGRSDQPHPDAPINKDEDEKVERAWTSEDLDTPRCPHCNDPFWTKGDVMSHVIQEHPEIEPAGTCVRCGCCSRGPGPEGEVICLGGCGENGKHEEKAAVDAP